MGPMTKTYRSNSRSRSTWPQWMSGSQTATRIFRQNCQIAARMRY
jgi:hypothetical protein